MTGDGRDFIAVLSRKQASGSYLVERTKLLRECRDAVQHGDWVLLRELAFDALGAGHTGVQLVREEGAAALAEQRHRTNQAARLIEALETMLASDEASVLAELEEALLDAPPDERALLTEWLKALRAGNTAPLVDHLTAPAQLRPNISAQAARGLLAGGLHARVIAEFNLSYVQGAGGNGSRNQLDDALAATTADVAESLRQRQTALYVAALDSAIGAVDDAATAIVRTVEESLPSFVRAQARCRAVSDTGTRSLGPALARAGRLTREAMASHAAACAILLDGAGMLPSAPALPFELSLPDGKDTSLSNINEVGDGSYIEVEGHVVDLDVFREAGGKLLSRMTLADGRDRNRVTAIAVYTHLPHRGVTGGAYCRLSGTFRSSSTMNEGNAAIEIERLRLADAAKASWLAAYLRAGQDLFPAWPNGLNMSWSLGPHQPTDDAPLMHVGAGEFLTNKTLSRRRGEREGDGV